MSLGGNVFTEEDIGVVPPSDTEAEEAVIGAMMCSPEAAALGVQTLRTDDFVLPSNQLMFTCAARVFNEGRPVDAVTVSSELEKSGVLDDVGGIAFLRMLKDSVPSAGNVEHYVQAVKEASTARKVLVASQRTVDLVQENASSEDLIRNLEVSLLRINEEAGRSDFHSIGSIMTERYKNLGETPIDESIASGYDNIDKLIGGLSPGRMYVVAARPGEGKSALAMGIAQSVSLQSSGSVLVYSLEMAKEEVSDRVVCAQAGVVSEDMKSGNLDADGWYRVWNAIGKMEKADMLIDDDTTLNFIEMRAKARRYAARHKIALIVVDYLQLLSFDGRTTESRQQEISTMTRNVKKLSMELNVPLIILSQLNREVELRKDKEPQLSDLRESGAIEQDADVVMFIYFDPDDQGRTLAKIKVAKNRQGKTGVAKLVFTREYTRFRDLVYTTLSN